MERCKLGIFERKGVIEGERRGTANSGEVSNDQKIR